MTTDWQLVRAMMAAAIDACEGIEKLPLTEQDRDAVGEVGDRKASVFDTLTSAWVYPERVRYQIIRERHARGADQPYLPETARLLVAMAQACSELVGAADTAPAETECRRLIDWYGRHALPLLEDALKARSGPGS
ncbi:MAG TPA: hypothetical protein VGU45_13280 [Microvirga sp.]|jgi:hypothetical protein|nr:hypothetical protein [Microvirga sp.]